MDKEKQDPFFQFPCSFEWELCSGRGAVPKPVAAEGVKGDQATHCVTMGESRQEKDT